jgi:hypothetical protein
MYIRGVMPRSRKRYSFWIDLEQADALKEIKERDGVPESEAIRRALYAWLEQRGVTVKPERKRAVIRKRS